MKQSFTRKFVFLEIGVLTFLGMMAYNPLTERDGGA
jgi:hypothetical protein